MRHPEAMPTEAVQPDTPGYRRDIDGLRAIAVLLVVVHHAFPQVLGAGFIGVDVFFVISGFLISSIIFRERDNGRWSLARFYERRVNRIFPALLLVMACCLAASFLLRDVGLRSQIGKHVAAGAGFVQNFVLLGESGYFDIEARAKPLLHLWSLAVEEQFYLFWPLLLALPGVAGPARRTLLLAVLALSFATNLWLSAVEPDLTYYLPFTRFWELALGGLLALDPRIAAGRPLHPSLAVAGTPVGLALLAAGLALASPHAAFPNWVGLLPTLGTALIIAAGPAAPVNRRVLGSRILVGLGLLSYPLYLWHWPLLSFLHLHAGAATPAPAAMAAALFASLLLAWLTYRGIELPLRRLASVRVRAASLAGGMLVLSVLAAATWRWPHEEAAGRGMALETYRDAWQFDAACLQTYRGLFAPRVMSDRDYCTASRPGAARTVFVLGDSHANRLGIGLQQVDPATNYINIARGNCLPFLGADGSFGDRKPLHCQPTSDAILQAALASPADAIVLAAFFSHAFSQEFVPAGPELAATLPATMRALGTSGKPVVLMLNVPALPFHPRNCLPVRSDDGEMLFPPCRMPRELHDRDTARYADLLRAAAAPYPNIRIFDPTPLLCDTRHCHGARNQRLLYWDPSHLNSEAAAMVAREVAKLLEATP